MDTQSALGFAIELLKAGRTSNYGYDYYSSTVARLVAESQTQYHTSIDAKVREYFPFFEEAGWILATRGILRPGVRAYQAQGTGEGGYSLTSQARGILDTLDESSALLYASNTLTDALMKFSDKFGTAFEQRAKEAVHCRETGAFFASCVMSGAATEAVLLAIANEKTGDAEMVRKRYLNRNGRKEVLQLISGSAKAYIREGLQGFVGVTGYWRDEAGHGDSTAITQSNADEAVRQLLHFCQWTEREWENLTTARSAS